MQQRGGCRESPGLSHAVKHGAGTAIVDSFGCDCCRWIDAAPADAVEPDFGPGMRIGLADDEIVERLIQFAALVAEYDSSGNAGGAHQDGEG